MVKEIINHECGCIEQRFDYGLPTLWVYCNKHDPNLDPELKAWMELRAEWAKERGIKL